MDKYVRGVKLADGDLRINSKVYAARNKQTNQKVVLKIMLDKECARKEAAIQQRLMRDGGDHWIAEIIESFQLNENFVIVMRQYEINLHDVHNAHSIPSKDIQTYMKQLLQGLNFMHHRGIIHRDIKSHNLLIDDRNVLKIGDLGSSRLDDVGDKTPSITTLWYRPIEVLLGNRDYTNTVDIWSAGCVMAELYRRSPLFQFRDEIPMIRMICEVCGTPGAPLWQDQFPGLEWLTLVENNEPQLRRAIPFANNRALNLIRRMFQFNYIDRVSANDALDDPYFHQEDDSPINDNQQEPDYPPPQPRDDRYMYVL